MVMTFLEAIVPSEKWDILRQTYAEKTKRLPPQIVQSYLNQSSTDPTMWQIITLWHSREKLEEYRASVETPGGVLMFRMVDAEPTLLIFDVIVHAKD